MRILVLTVAVQLISGRLLAQMPKDVPYQSEPVDFSDPKNVLLYIGVPLLMIALFIMIRRWRRNRRD